MKEFQPADIRNFCLTGHWASGKTTLSEAMLACSGSINRMGSVKDKNTVSDYHEDEHRRQISIHASLLNTTWLSKKLNFLDTPGNADFIGEAIGALAVSDFAIIVVHAGHGVEVGTEQLWDLADHFDIPKVIVVNAIDKENVDFEKVYAQIKERFGSKVFPFSWPMSSGPSFHRILDVPRDEVITYATDQSGKSQESAASGEWKAKVDELHKELIEHVAESDNALLEKFFAQGGLSEKEWREGIHASVQNRAIIPLFAVSAEKNVGVSRLLDFIAKYGSSPVDRKTVKAIGSDDKPVLVDLAAPEPVLFVFKTLGEAHVGEMSYFRVYAGHVDAGTDLLNTANGETERVGTLSVLNGHQRETVKRLNAGDIGAAVKMKHTHTGNTLASPGFAVRLPQPELPPPSIELAIRPKASGDEDKLVNGLTVLHEEDPTFNFRFDPERGETVVSGRGELHLQVTMERLKERFKVDVILSDARIPHRETLRGTAESRYKHKKQSGGAGQFAEVWLRVAAGPRGSGVHFTQSLTGQNVDRSFVPSVEKGVMAACEEGVLARYRVTDVTVDFFDGRQHPVDSKDIAFQIAGKEAFKEAFLAAQPVLLEPIDNVDVKVPEEYLGAVMGDISARRGKITGTDTDGHFRVVHAQIPKAELLRYSTALRSLTGGRGEHTELFSHYDEMPPELQQGLIQEHKKTA
jgi:elongation factor G